MLKSRLVLTGWTSQDKYHILFIINDLISDRVLSLCSRFVGRMYIEKNDQEPAVRWEHSYAAISAHFNWRQNQHNLLKNSFVSLRFAKKSLIHWSFIAGGHCFSRCFQSTPTFITDSFVLAEQTNDNVLLRNIGSSGSPNCSHAVYSHCVLWSGCQLVCKASM